MRSSIGLAWSVSVPGVAAPPLFREPTVVLGGKRWNVQTNTLITSLKKLTDAEGLSAAQELCHLVAAVHGNTVQVEIKLFNISEWKAFTEDDFQLAEAEEDEAPKAPAVEEAAPAAEKKAKRDEDDEKIASSPANAGDHPAPRNWQCRYLCKQYTNKKGQLVPEHRCDHRTYDRVTQLCGQAHNRFSKYRYNHARHFCYVCDAAPGGCECNVKVPAMEE